MNTENVLDKKNTAWCRCGVKLLLSAACYIHPCECELAYQILFEKRLKCSSTLPYQLTEE
jgi:hypothetical protein